MSASGMPCKPFRVQNPDGLPGNDDGGRGFQNWVALLNTGLHLDAVCGGLAAGTGFSEPESWLLNAGA